MYSWPAMQENPSDFCAEREKLKWRSEWLTLLWIEPLWWH